MSLYRSLRALGHALALASLAYGAATPAQVPTYNVGSTPTGVPFTFLDVKTNTIQGAMVDLITAIGEDAGFKVNVQATPFSALVPSLTSNKIDIISAAMLINPQRKEVIDFSDPVFPYPEGMVVSASDNTPYKTLADVKGQIVGAQVGTVYVDFLKKNGEFADVRVYDSLADILRDVSLGRIKAGFGDAPILKYQLAQNPDFKAKLVSTYEPKMAGSVGIGVRKTDQELLKKINASLAKLNANGTVDKILAKWNLK
ncbi:MAG TPA: ABC transporter substrate-binding protein [Casimicrobiaceae bacterium]|nr:ABC transporter substrate-binding protein [Casimicrobiaceae bacterium]